MESMTDKIVLALAQELELPDVAELVRVVVRLTASALLAGLLGAQREHAHKPAGLRTHILVSMAATLLVMLSQLAGMREEAESRVIQGIVSGVGFVCAGSIIKSREQVVGLTTATTLWLATGIGITVGLVTKNAGRS